MTFGKSIVSKLLDVYPAPTALLDERGTILVVNRAWKEFGTKNGLDDPAWCEDWNYLEECRRAHARGLPAAASICDGVRGVLSGATSTFNRAYTCHSPTEERWFHLIVAPFSPSTKRHWAVVLHIDTTHQRQLARRYLRRSEKRIDPVTICAWCNLIQWKPGHWISVEKYFSKHQGIRFSHGICNHCLDSLLDKPAF